MVNHEMVLGGALGITASFVSNVAILIQKHAADVESHKPWRMRWRFWLGFGLNVLSQAVITSFALSLAPLSLLAPLSGLAVVFNALLARFGCVCGVREDLSRTDWICTMLIVLGITIASIAGPGTAPPAPPLTVADLPVVFSNPLYIGYFASGTLCILCWLSIWQRPSLAWLKPSDDSLLASVGSGSTAAFCGSVSVVSLKVVVSCVGDLAGGTPPLEVAAQPIAWAALLGLCSFAPLQLFLLNQTLGSGQATFTIPLFLSLTMILVSVSGGILFDEYDSMASRGAIYIAGYAAGVLLIIVGLATLSHRREKAGLNVGAEERASSKLLKKRARRRALFPTRQRGEWAWRLGGAG